MSRDNSKRFTDREVALILKNAADLDEVQGSGPTKGLSRSDLEEIAAEVGISVDSITQAIDMIGVERSGTVCPARARSGSGASRRHSPKKRARRWAHVLSESSRTRWYSPQSLRRTWSSAGDSPDSPPTPTHLPDRCSN